MECAREACTEGGHMSPVVRGQGTLNRLSHGGVQVQQSWRYS